MIQKCYGPGRGGSGGGRGGGFGRGGSARLSYLGFITLQVVMVTLYTGQPSSQCFDPRYDTCRTARED